SSAPDSAETMAATKLPLLPMAGNAACLPSSEVIKTKKAGRLASWTGEAPAVRDNRNGESGLAGLEVAKYRTDSAPGAQEGDTSATPLVNFALAPVCRSSLQRCI